MAETFAVHGLRDGRLELAETFGRGDTLRTALLSELELKLEDIFAN